MFDIVSVRKTPTTDASLHILCRTPKLRVWVRSRDLADRLLTRPRLSAAGLLGKQFRVSTGAVSRGFDGFEMATNYGLNASESPTATQFLAFPAADTADLTMPTGFDLPKTPKLLKGAQSMKVVIPLKWGSVFS